MLWTPWNRSADICTITILGRDSLSLLRQDTQLEQMICKHLFARLRGRIDAPRAHWKAAIRLGALTGRAASTPERLILSELAVDLAFTMVVIRTCMPWVLCSRYTAGAF